MSSYFTLYTTTWNLPVLLDTYYCKPMHRRSSMSGAFISDLLARKTHPCFTYARPCHTALFHPTPRYPRPTAHCSIDPPDMHPSTLVQVHTFVAPPQHQVTSTYMFHHPRTSATASQHHLLSRRWRQVPFEGAQPVDLSRKLRHHGWLLLLPLLRYGLCRNRSNLLKRHLQKLLRVVSHARRFL